MAGSSISVGSGNEMAEAFARMVAEGFEKALRSLEDNGKLSGLFSSAMRKAFTDMGNIDALLPRAGGGGLFGGAGAGLESLMGIKIGGSDVGGIMDMLGGGSDMGGILDTVLGGASGGPLGMLWSAYKVFDRFTKKATNAPMAEVKKINSDSINMFGDNLGVLMGSEIFGGATFSSRNINGDVMRKFASVRNRTAPEVTVNIKPSREFDAISDAAWVRSSKRNEMGGIPMRTNFTHG